MCQRCTAPQASCPEQWNWTRSIYGMPLIDDATLAQNVRNAMRALAAHADAAQKAGLAVDFTATFIGGFSPVAVVPGSIYLAEISRTTTHKVVL